MYVVLFLHYFTYQHQNKILPQEDGPRTKTTLVNIIVQFIQCAALGVKGSQHILFPFFTSLVFMWCLKIIIFREDLSIPGTLWMSWRSRGNRSTGWGARQEQKTNYPWPVIHGPHNLQWNSTLIVGKTIHHPHLTMQINPSKISLKIPIHWADERDDLFLKVKQLAVTFIKWQNLLSVHFLSIKGV